MRKGTRSFNQQFVFRASPTLYKPPSIRLRGRRLMRATTDICLSFTLFKPGAQHKYVTTESQRQPRKRSKNPMLTTAAEVATRLKYLLYYAIKLIHVSIFLLPRNAKNWQNIEVERMWFRISPGAFLLLFMVCALYQLL